MKRRDALQAFVAVAAAGPASGPAQPQRVAGPRVLGLLYPNPGSVSGGPAGAKLKELGWIVGANLLAIDASSEGNNDRLDALAAELVRKPVDVIWTAGPEATIAAARATLSIPISFYGVGLPVEQGLVDALARPGRNVTGLAALAGGEETKRLEILKEVVPTARRLAIVRTATVLATLAGGEYHLPTKDLEAAAAALGFEPRILPVSTPEDLDTAFAKIVQFRADAVSFDLTALTFRERDRIAEFTRHSRLPSAGGTREFAEAGGLIAYGADRWWMILRSFHHVDKLLRGAPPAELPVELPSKFELTLNRKTARALGIDMAQSVLLRADRVID